MKLINSKVVRLLLTVVIALYSVTFALAQNTSNAEYPKVEVFVGYSALGDNNQRVNFSSTAGVTGSYANTAGFETSITRNFTRHIGLKGDFSAHFNNRSGNFPVTFFEEPLPDASAPPGGDGSL